MSNSKVISIDLAKDVFEIAVANHAGRILQRKRLGRKAFARFLHCHEPAIVLMEACGSAHHWGRIAKAVGHQPRLIPAQYVRPYRRRNKTDRTDVEALLEAHRCAGIKPVPVRSVQQQQLQLLHRMREQWKKTRVARINALRGSLRELGLAIPEGPAHAIRAAHLAIDRDTVPKPLAHALYELLEEVTALEHRIHSVEVQLKTLTKDIPEVKRMQQVSGIGLLTSTALFAAAGSAHHFPSGKHFASWLGITPREFSSGKRRYLGSISKLGDKYLRTLIIHGARSVLARANQLFKAGKHLNPLQQWALNLQNRAGHNKAAVALANKLARIVWAVWKYERDFEPNPTTP